MARGGTKFIRSLGLWHFCSVRLHFGAYFSDIVLASKYISKLPVGWGIMSHEHPLPVRITVAKSRPFGFGSTIFVRNRHWTQAKINSMVMVRISMSFDVHWFEYYLWGKFEWKVAHRPREAHPTTSTSTHGTDRIRWKVTDNDLTNLLRKVPWQFCPLSVSCSTRVKTFKHELLVPPTIDIGSPAWCSSINYSPRVWVVCNYTQSILLPWFMYTLQSSEK